MKLMYLQWKNKKLIVLEGYKFGFQKSWQTKLTVGYVQKNLEVIFENN